jgi:hypothetical protein
LKDYLDFGLGFGSFGFRDLGILGVLSVEYG